MGEGFGVARPGKDRQRMVSWALQLRVEDVPGRKTTYCWSPRLPHAVRAMHLVDGFLLFSTDVLVGGMMGVESVRLWIIEGCDDEEERGGGGCLGG